MPLDFPAAGQALWSLFDRGGPRPEYVLVVLWAESGFDASVQNAGGAPYYGVNQASADLIAAYAKTDPQTYLSWPASQQIGALVTPMLLSIVGQYGSLESGARVEQANFLPATLAKARALSDVVVRFPDAAYSGNAALDVAKKGSITVGDLAAFVGKGAKSAQLQAAIARTYELRPTETSHDPVLGDDFGAAGAGALALAISLGFAVYAARYL